VQNVFVEFGNAVLNGSALRTLNEGDCLSVRSSFSFGQKCQRTTRRAGYEVSQKKRKPVEQSVGWMKMVGTLKKV
jgi:hypothetical protein